MLQVNEEFLISKTPQRDSDEAFAMSSQGLVGKPDPVAERNPSSRPASRARSTPVWQAALLAS